MFDEELGLSESIKINVYDTPGFDDANIENIQKNKLLIATTLKYDIDVIIYITTDARFKETNQVWPSKPKFKIWPSNVENFI